MQKGEDGGWKLKGKSQDSWEGQDRCNKSQDAGAGARQIQKGEEEGWKLKGKSQDAGEGQDRCRREKREDENWRARVKMQGQGARQMQKGEGDKSYLALCSLVWAATSECQLRLGLVVYSLLCYLYYRFGSPV